MPLAARLQTAIKQIEFARTYTQSLLDQLEEELWTVQVAGVSNIAWQVGHLAMAQYGLCLFRQRGRQAVDSGLMSSRFRKQFSKGSSPSPETQPSPEEIREVFQRVHQQALREMPTFPDAELDTVIDEPYAAYNTRLGALLFCSHHELLHAGQIGLLRRLLGKPAEAAPERT